MQSQRSLRSSHDLLISQQVTKGFELLSEKNNIVKRLGGIYALEGVMNDGSSSYHRPVLEALCAFVRDGTLSHMGEGPPATDIQAAFTVIGRRSAEADDEIDLVSVRIPNITLSRPNLSGAHLSRGDLSGATLLLGAISPARFCRRESLPALICPAPT